jgi:hypothetical protein
MLMYAQTSSPFPCCLYFTILQGRGLKLTTIVATSKVPVVLKNDIDLKRYLAQEGPTSYCRSDIVVSTLKGSKLAVVDLVPGGQSLMHRTVSIDYSICVIGHVRMELDSGDFVDLYPGDHVIQRGTMHKWYNGSSTNPARFVAVTLPCEPFEIPGTGEVLNELHLATTGSKQENENIF